MGVLQILRIVNVATQIVSVPQQVSYVMLQRINVQGLTTIPRVQLQMVVLQTIQYVFVGILHVFQTLVFIAI